MTWLIRALTGALLAGGLATGLTPVPPAAAAADPTRVLIVGDSITQGRAGDHTWRFFAWRWLKVPEVAGADTEQRVDLVGNKTGTFDWGTWDAQAPGRYADEDFDVDHSATWGGRLVHQLDGARVRPEWGTLAIRDLTRQYRPDVVVSLWGINDLNAGLTPRELIGRYRRWIAQARFGHPEVDLVLGRLAWTWAAAPGRVPTFNRRLGRLAASTSTPQSRVIVAAPAQHYRRSDTYDGVHPAASGEKKIASVVLTALDRVGVPVRSTAPHAPGRVRASRDGRQVVLRWSRPARAKLYVVRCTTDARSARPRTVLSRTVWRTSTRFRTPSRVTCRVRALNAVGSSGWSQPRTR